MWSSYFSFLGLVFSIAFLSTKFHQNDLTSHHNSATYFSGQSNRFGFITFSVTILELTEQSPILKLFCVSFSRSGFSASQFFLCHGFFLLTLCPLALVYSMTVLSYYVYSFFPTFFCLNGSLQFGTFNSSDFPSFSIF